MSRAGKLTGSFSDSVDVPTSMSSSSAARRLNLASSSAASVGCSASSRASRSSIEWNSQYTIWNQNFFEFSFFFPTVGPVWPMIKLPIRPGMRTSPRDPLSRSSGGALPGLPRSPRSLNGTMWSSTIQSGLMGYSMGMQRFVTGGAPGCGAMVGGR